MNKIIIAIISITLLGTSAFAENQDAKKGVPVFTEKELKKYGTNSTVTDDGPRQSKFEVQKNSTDVAHKPVLVKPGDPGYPTNPAKQKFKLKDRNDVPVNGPVNKNQDQ